MKCLPQAHAHRLEESEDYDLCEPFAFVTIQQSVVLKDANLRYGWPLRETAVTEKTVQSMALREGRIAC